MSAPELVPAGWLSAPDLLARVCDHLHALSQHPLTDASAASLAALFIADAMASTRPGVAAFVQGEGQTFMIPGQVWRVLADPSGTMAPDLVATFTTGRCRGRAFGEYEGLQLLFSYAETMIWLAPVAQLAAVKCGVVRGDDADRPWRAFKSVKAWLKHPVAATRFADDLLTAQGQTTLDERARRKVLDAHLRAHGVNFGPDTVSTSRRAGGHTI